MICLTKRNLVIDATHLGVSPLGNNAIVFAPGDTFTKEGWQVNSHNREEDLHEIWRRLVSPPPANNRFLLIWDRPDSYLQELLQFVHRQQSQFRIEVSLLFAGPMTSEVSFDSILSLRDEGSGDRFVSTVWYVGNEDTEKRSIGPDDRSRLIAEALSFLLAGNDRLLDALRLFPGNQGLPPFTAFGIRSWQLGTDGAEEIVRYASALVIRDELADGNASTESDERSCHDESNSCLQKLRSLNTPYSRGNADSSDSTVPFIEKFSPPPENPFYKWACPLLREIAVIKGKAQVIGQRVITREYYWRLKAELQDLGRVVRQNGQAIFDATRTSCRDFICQNPTISHLEVLLRVYFPAMRSKTICDTRSPCESASVPDLSDCDRWFVKEASAELEEACLSLPSIKQAIMLGVVGLILVLTSCVLLYFKMGWKPVAAPIACAVFLGVSFLWWATRVGKRMAVHMREYFDLAYGKLRQTYSDKLMWVVNNTQTLLERQVLAEVAGVGNRLNKNYHDLFADWERHASSEGEAKLSELISRMELEREGINFVRDHICNSARDLLEDAMQDAPPIAGKRKAQELKDRLSQEIIRQARARTVDHERVAEQVLACMSRQDPPVLARIDSGRLQDDKTYKVFLLPDSYPNWEDRLGTLGRRNLLDVRFWRDAIVAPVVLTARSHLTEDEMKTSLAVTEAR